MKYHSLDVSFLGIASVYSVASVSDIYHPTSPTPLPADHNYFMTMIFPCNEA
jgi:hypothetical protein